MKNYVKKTDDDREREEHKEHREKQTEVKRGRNMKKQTNKEWKNKQMKKQRDIKN